MDCLSGFFNDRDDFSFSQLLDIILIERLERKSDDIHETWLANNKNWEETLYQFFLQSFSFKNK